MVPDGGAGLVRDWIPAFAGMTVWRWRWRWMKLVTLLHACVGLRWGCAGVDSRLRGNDGVWCVVCGVRCVAMGLAVCGYGVGGAVGCSALRLCGIGARRLQIALSFPRRRESTAASLFEMDSRLRGHSGFLSPFLQANTLRSRLAKTPTHQKQPL